MPYLSLRTVENQPVEVPGDSEAGFAKAIEKHGRIARPDKALVWIRAFFVRRSIQIARQKLLQVGDEEGADKLNDSLDAAEDAEETARDAYYASVTQPAEEAKPVATASSVDPNNPYGDVEIDGSGAQDEDDFM